MKLAAVSIKRPVFATMMIGVLLILGIFSYAELSVDLFPEIDFPIATVVTIYPGASAETVESEVTKKIDSDNDGTLDKEITLEQDGSKTISNISP